MLPASAAKRGLFRRESSLTLRFFIAALLAGILLLLDTHSHLLQPVRAGMECLAAPIQYAVDFPITVVRWLSQRVTTEQALLMDNARLRAHELLLESKLEKLLSLERENASLRSLLSSAPELRDRVSVAQLLAVDLDPSRQQVVLDKGRYQHVFRGQPVLDAYGVMGQVIDPGYLTSRVLLITDSRSAVPVKDNRSSVRSVALGQGQAELTLLAVADTSDIKEGDLFVTSGLGLHFPVGYPVGRVVSIKHQPGQQFSEVKLLPVAHLDRSQQVILVWPKA